MNTSRFKDITRYDIGSYFIRFKDFCENQYPLIVQYYGGGTIDAMSFSILNQLIEESKQIEPLFESYSTTLSTIDMWEIMESFSEVQTKLLTIKNSSRWLRSSISDNLSPSVSVERLLKTNETFEDVSESLGDEDPQDDWVNIAIANYRSETSYTDEDGGSLFKVSLENTDEIEVDNIVDNLVGIKSLGKDLDKSITIENNDLRVVEYQSAIKQSLETIVGATKGCIPEFPEYGINKDSFVGSNINSIQYPVIFKNLLSMFQRDSRWRNVELIDLKIDKDAVFMKIRCTTVIDSEETTNVKI